ncbi:hypothetical protein [Noviherbaspirillum soli]|uniref:hypothetical protein n=1 Tax=Noviherbaspirillum soli TaxID=1064518 RepID=UPI00188C08DB|nr:hypothetical protein [Noviherbaspirillum soli]
MSSLAHGQGARAGAGAAMHGQALTEFLVISLVLIPLFLLLPVIGKYQDISHASQMASRYAAFDAVLRNDGNNSHKSPSQLRNELRQRYFGPAQAGIRSGPEQKAALKDYWNDPFGKPLIRNPDDIALSFGASHGEKHADGYTRASDTLLFPWASLAGLSTNGIYRANVAVRLANLPEGVRSIEPFDKLDLTIERHASVLPDAWTAASPMQAEQRFGRMAPINAVIPESVISPAIKYVDLNKVEAPRFGDLTAWRDVVPQDRLQGKKTP